MDVACVLPGQFMTPSIEPGTTLQKRFGELSEEIQAGYEKDAPERSKASGLLYMYTIAWAYPLVLVTFPIYRRVTRLLLYT